MAPHTGTGLRLTQGYLWLLWPLIGTLLPRGRFLDLTLLVTAAVVIMLLTRLLAPTLRISVSRDVRSLAAVAGSQVASLGVALYVAGMAVSRVLVWSTAQKVFAILVTGSVATSLLASEFEWGWIFGQMSDLQAGSEAADLPYLP
jgi:hypothetical protein